MLNLLVAALIGSASLPAAADLVVLQYHHVSDQTPASTSTTPDLFRRQLAMLEKLDIPVKPLQSATEQALNGKTGRQPVAALTFDDAYSSVYDTAAPILLKAGIPFTVFVNSQAITEQRHGYMTWDQLRDLASHPEVTIGNHSADHAHLVRRPDEAEDAWHTRVSASLDEAQKTIEARLGTDAPLFAYPYGEFDAAVETLVKQRGWYGYGQHSGPIGPTSADTRLPRFPMANAYGGVDGLKDKLLSETLPVDASQLPDGTLNRNPPVLQLDLPDHMKPGPLTCYGSQVGRLSVTPVGDGHSVEIVADRPFDSRRFRYNCTYPAGNGRYYWQSVQWLDLSQPED
ncbi:polysaccharide deacetylase [Marinobacter halodurans]|uniref:Polysaccharide deacetylase n=1 Tax=Marinobacter halodurans TaxID=2528979 RepID=A0ABY1ZU27_9GAMM|nr:polysaccharide deacetylase [Marinobacter halodurans]